MISMGSVMAAAALTGLLSAQPARWEPQELLARGHGWGSDRSQRDAARQDELYREGQEAIDEGRWQRAIERFTELAQAKGSRTDAALYWRAYALDRLGQKADALAAAAELI
jgi:outer membrane protein assembly factor BamD (BamD/ComL family)